MLLAVPALAQDEVPAEDVIVTDSTTTSDITSKT